MLGADVVSLGDDWMLVLPAIDFRSAAGARIEGAGVHPDIAVKEARQGDPDLAAALKFLKAGRSAHAPDRHILTIKM
jgi:C-terminal processing protease CtpA/Prc